MNEQNAQDKIVSGMPFAEYLKLERFSKSLVYDLVKSPKHLRHSLDHPDDEMDWKMTIGSLVDCLLMEPHEIVSRFWIQPDTYINSEKKTVAWNLNSKTCREKRDEAVHNGTIPVSSRDMERANAICKAIKAHPKAGDWLARGKYQQTLLWHDEVTKLYSKGRIDILVPDKLKHEKFPERIVDLKCTASASPEAFSRVLDTMLYHVQGAMYHDGLYKIISGQNAPNENATAESGEKSNFFVIPYSFIIAEYDPPFDVVCADLDPDSLIIGRAQYQKSGEKYRDCTEMNEWPGRSDDVETVGLPMWKINRFQERGVV